MDTVDNVDNTVRADNLRRLWNSHRPTYNGRRMRQAEAAKLMSVSGTATSRQLSGDLPLSTHSVLLWAQLLRVSPRDIDPGFPDVIFTRQLCPEEQLPIEEQTLLSQYRVLREGDKRAVIEMAKALRETRRP